AKFTVRGWCFLAAAVLCLAAATWLGRKDVLALSLFLGMVPLLSSLAMWLVKPRVLLKRSVDPPLVTLGDAAQVALRVRRRSAFSARNRTSGAARAGSTHDPVDPAVHDMGTAGGGLTGGMGDGPADAANPGRGAGPDTTDADRRGTLRSGRTSAVAAVDVHETVDPLLGRDQDVSVPVSGAPVTYTVRGGVDHHDDRTHRARRRCRDVAPRGRWGESAREQQQRVGEPLPFEALGQGIGRRLGFGPAHEGRSGEAVDDFRGGVVGDVRVPQVGHRCLAA
ncbi:hypothetical protein K1Y78_60645, partial [Streptomyces sp. tea 10]|nr:hypothetical protein [Streptomyces sp. tea 10]